MIAREEDAGSTGGSGYTKAEPGSEARSEMAGKTQVRRCLLDLIRIPMHIWTLTGARVISPSLWVVGSRTPTDTRF